MANLNSTQINGSLKVTDTIYGNLSGNATSAISATSATSATNATNATKADYLTGFTRRNGSIGWGTLTSANGYTFVTDIAHQGSGDSGDIAFAGKQVSTSTYELSCQIDGCFYQRTGLKRCVDTSEVNLLDKAVMQYNSSTDSIDFSFQ